MKLIIKWTNKEKYKMNVINGNEYYKGENNINIIEAKNNKNDQAENLTGTNEKGNLNNEEIKE